jgi:membrane-associated protease RseP (regulator of RpoE activity)
MRKYVVTSIVLLPLLLTFSHAAQNVVVDPPSQAWGIFSSEDSSTGAYLGVDISDVTPERVSALKLKEEKGVEVTMVDQDAPAGKAGIKEHDVILTMNGTTVESAAQLRRMIHETPAGRVIALGLSRDGQPLVVKVQLGDRHKEFSFTGPNMKDFHVEIPEVHVMPDIDIPSINMVVVTSSVRSGLMVENITPQLGEFFGVKNGNGVLVRSVEKGSRAEKAGFHAGDVIVKVNDQSVHDTSDFTRAVKSRTGDSVNVGVVRDKKEQNLTLALPTRKESSLIDEESFEEPLVSAESALELGEVQDELAKLRPEMALAAENARKAAQEMQKNFRQQQKRFEERARQEAEKARQQAEREKKRFEREQEKMKQELDRMQQEMQGKWLDI